MSSTLGWAWSHARPYRIRVSVLAVLSTLEIALRVLAPFAMAIVVDEALSPSASGDREARLVTFVLLGLGMQLAHQVVVMLHGRLSVVVGQRMIRDLRARLFAHVQGLELAHHARTPTGDAVSRLEADTRCVEHVVMRGLFPLVFSALTLVVMFCILLAIDLRLALLAIAIVPPLYIWLRYYARRMAPRADHARRSDSRLSSRLFESISAIRLVKSHAREDHEEARFCRVADDAAQAWIGVGRAGAVFAIVNGALTVIGSSAILLVGGYAVLAGRITVGTLLLVLAYVGYVYGPLSAIASTTNELQNAFASARRVRDVLAIVPEGTDAPAAIAADGIRGEVAFEDVTFAYGDKQVLDGVSFTAKPGELIALVGPSGAGKSTLASLIMRFYDPKTGTIAIDGRPIDHYKLRSLRERIAIVLQDAVMMSGTVRDNLRYGKLDATDLQLEAAAHAAHAHDFITALPHGYDTELGEGGAGLSGGQRQRLSIARAFLKNAPIVILDEPTAALDTISEAQVVEAIGRLTHDRTTFIVAHRLSTVRKADRILVMDKGRIVAEGTHEELRTSNLLYRQLAAQLSDSPIPDAAHATA
jgi:ABC-type multidrug transport system fused ATPase/permease subunit